MVPLILSVTPIIFGKKMYNLEIEVYDDLPDVRSAGRFPLKLNDVIWNPTKSYRYYLVNSRIQNRKGISALTLLLKSFRFRIQL